jgi:WhiB family transcriptional regulator, redox-sensing transcriptional regulator
LAGHGQIEGEAVLASLVLPERDTGWFRDASCARVLRATGVDYWFPDRKKPFALMEKMGKFICSKCPVKGQCLEDAIEHGWEFGIWGGLTPEERKHLGHNPEAALREVVCLAA